MNPASNVDPAEIAKFNEIASRWWDPSGEFKPLHQLNPCRLAFISDQVQGLFGKKAVDVGCGGGILAEAMAKAGAEVTGIDMADEALVVARLHALESGVKLDYQQSTAEQFAAGEGPIGRGCCRQNSASSTVKLGKIGLVGFGEIFGEELQV